MPLRDPWCRGPHVADVRWQLRRQIGNVTDFFGNGYEVSHLLSINNPENVPFPCADIGVGGGHLIVFGDRPAHGAELTLEWVGHQNADTMAMKAARQRQRLGKSSNCQKCRSIHGFESILPLCINTFTVFASNNLYIFLPMRGPMVLGNHHEPGHVQTRLGAGCRQRVATVVNFPS